MSEWTPEEMVEGLRSFSATDRRERFYEACAETIERLSSENELFREALQNICVHTAHNPDASRDLLTALLGRCLLIATEALNDLVSEEHAPDE